MHTWVDIATLTKKKVNQKRFAARFAASLFSLPEEGLKVAFVPPQLDAPRNGFLTEAVEGGSGSYDVLFEFEDEPWSDEALEQLVGCHVLARRSDVPAADEDEAYPSIAGMRVQDATLGFVGTARSIERYPGQDLLIVEREDGSELLVPFVEPIIELIDEDEQLISVSLPTGLLDL